MSKTKDAKDERDDAPKASTRHTDESAFLNQLLMDAGACVNEDEADALFATGKAYLDTNGILRVKNTGVYIALADEHLIEEAKRRAAGGDPEGPEPAPEHNDETATVEAPNVAAKSSLDEDEQRTQDQSASAHKTER